ncbi:MAG: CDP-alcohol phosphatidyltransferase family protein [Kiloniellales bacterium]|nr:CDP-alcohol phosphatidyltransferase family protein [Kiloniellales bacterium]
MRDSIPYDQRAARLLVRPLAKTRITPNHITGLTLLLALTAAGLFATGEAHHANWAAGLFVLARFLDHFDGELARLTGRTSRFGYYFDYVTGSISYATVYIGIGLGLAAGANEQWPLLLGLIAGGAAFATMFLELQIDRARKLGENEAVRHPGGGGFELEDGIYLLAPATWLGLLSPFFVLAAIGAVCYLLATAWSLAQARKLS